MTGGPVDVVLVGTSHPHVPSWLEAARALEVRLRGVWDPHLERARALAEEEGVSAVDLGDLGDGPILALVAGRNDELADLTLEALSHGLAVLVEKPGGFSAADVQRVEQASAPRVTPVRIGYFLRFADTVAQARDLLQADALGDVTLARFHAAMPASAWSDLREWFADPTNVRGTFLEDACHVVDIALLLLGEPAAVSAVSLDVDRLDGLGEAAFVAILRYEETLALVDFTAWEANPWVESWGLTLYGTRGTFQAGLMPPWAELYDGEAWRSIGAPRVAGGRALEQARLASHREYFRRALAAAVVAATGGESAAATLGEGRRVFQVIEDAYSAARVTSAAVGAEGDDT
jgi:predicted dehydrogenase